MFNNFLGLEYTVNTNGMPNYHIVLTNGSELIVEDHFFNKYPENKEYLSIENFPESITFSSNVFAQEDDVVILYGNEKMEWAR